jgi:hypothetical protein
MNLRTLLSFADKGSRISTTPDPEEKSAITDGPPRRPGRTAGPRPATPELGALEQEVAAAEAAYREADAKRSAHASALVAAGDGQATAMKLAEAERARFDDALAAHQLDGGPAPSRERLTAAEAAQRDAEDRVRALERRRPEIEQVWRRARIELLRAEEACERARAAALQSAINELAAEAEAQRARAAELSIEQQAILDRIPALVREADALRKGAIAHG